MGKVASIARRTFLVGSVAVAGGIAFGYYRYKTPYPNPLLNDLKVGEAAITPFVKIDAAGITLITPRADKGQGAYSLQAHLLAEELDVDPLRVTTSPGMPDKAYYNGAVMEEGAPGLGDVIGKFMGLQMTGGSSTAPDMFDRLRHAGAVARETLKLVAATKYKVPVEQLKTEDAMVILPTGEKVSYTDLAPLAATITPVDNVTLRSPHEWKYIGKKVRRTDIVGKSTGTQTYGIDLNFEGLLYATAKTNPAFGSGAATIDMSKAQNMRGVHKVIQIKGGIGIIADNTWRAFKAADAVDVTWEDGNYPASSQMMWAVLEDHVKPEFQNVERRNDGDTETALSSGDVLMAEYRTPHLAHAPLEPMNAVVKVEDDRVDIWTGTQIPRFIENHVSAATGIDTDNIHVHVQAMGGSFGRRLEDTYVMQALEIAQAVKGTPVKMTWSREEDMTHDYPRPMSISYGRGKVANGQVETMEMKMVAPSLIGSWMGRLAGAPPGPDPTITQGADDQPYTIDNYRVTGYKSPEMVPVSSWRSVAASQNGFYHEAFLDELIHKAGADPIAERLRLCNDPVAKAVIEEVARLAKWETATPAPNKGRGVAFVKSFGVPVAQIVDVTMTDEGIRIDDVFVVVDVGTVIDPVNIEAQLTGGVVWALGHAMNCELTYENYTAVQHNYNKYEGMRLYQTPTITVKALEKGDSVRGCGEPSVPPAAPALANAIFAATGQRLRELPLNRGIKFV